ncbi:MAG: hypothetical protein MUC88_24975 [Planctomycetes bacterium]|nr:hypothetical protein [Planctomycetota bacterium]
MNPHDALRDNLLQADGIASAGVSEAELTRFRRLLGGTKRAGISWPRRLKGPLAKLAVAAAVTVATARAKTFLWPGSCAVVWAAVLRKVNGFDTCTYRTREVTTTGPRPDGFEFATEKESRDYRSEAYGSFSETYENGQLTTRTYTLLRQKLHLYFSAARAPKVCFRSPVSDESIREFHTHDPRQIVAKILAGRYVEIGNDVIEGKAVRGVELRDPSFLMDEGQEPRRIEDFVEDFAARFWIDLQTQLPVWMEISSVLKGSTVRTTRIWDQFEWGVPLEESLFEPEIPADCRVIEHDPSRKAPDTRPKTPAEEAFAQHTLAAPYLGDFDALPLPEVGGLSLLGVDPSVPWPAVKLLGDTKIQLAHDACVARWPPYEQVRAQLQEELRGKLDLDARDGNGLVATGIALRNRFWELGGGLSEVAYPYIYGARLVAELAHQREPEDSAIIDQIAESIMAYEVFYYVEEPAPPGKAQKNPLYAGLLADWRGRQYQLLQAGLRRGETPTWKDFVRCCDFICLAWLREDTARCLEVTRLLMAQAEKTGWTFYLEGLQRGEQRLVAGERYRGEITFTAPLMDVSQAQYGRRLWSFQGPPQYRRTRLPMHLKHLRTW